MEFPGPEEGERPQEQQQFFYRSIAYMAAEGRRKRGEQ